MIFQGLISVEHSRAFSVCGAPLQERSNAFLDLVSHLVEAPT
jgi:hypothetical protein